MESHGVVRSARWSRRASALAVALAALAACRAEEVGAVGGGSDRGVAPGAESSAQPLAGGAAVASDAGDRPPAESVAREGASASSPADAAVARVHGVVRWEGEIPARRVFDVSGSADVLRLVKGTLLDDDYVIDSGTLTVAGVLAFVEPALGLELPSPATEPARIECRGGRYVPHVLAMQAGQPLRIEQVDDYLLNVHFLPSANDELNFLLPGPGHRTRHFPSPEPGWMKVKSDVHPWMSAWIAVLAHPWFAVTSADGRYEIAGVPPGFHTLVLRHPRAGEQRLPIELAAGGELAHDFVLRAPPKGR